MFELRCIAGVPTIFDKVIVVRRRETFLD